MEIEYKLKQKVLETLKGLGSYKDGVIHYYIHFLKKQQHKKEKTLYNILNKGKLTTGYEAQSFHLVLKKPVSDKFKLQR